MLPRILRILPSINLFVLIVLIGIFMWLNSKYADMTDLKTWSAYFYNAETWESVKHFVRNNEKMRVGYYLYLKLEIVFIPAYMFMLLRFADGLNRTGKKIAWILILILVGSDVIENILLWGLQNIPPISAIKFTAFFVLVGMVTSHEISKITKVVHAALYTLWYSRMSVFTLFTMAILMTMPQGKDLLIYMLEGDWREMQLLIFNITTFLTGVVCWYAPRFLYPENPPQDHTYSISCLFNHAEWANHFKESAHRVPGASVVAELSERSGRDLTDKGPSRLMQKKGEISALQVARNAIEQPRKHQEQTVEKINDDDVEAIRDLIKVRTYVPLLLSLVFYSLLFVFFYNVLSNMSNSNAESSWIKGAAFGVVLIFGGLIISSEHVRSYFTKLIMRFITGRRIHFAWIGFAVVGSILLVGVRIGNNGLSKTAIIGQLMLIVAQILLILSVSHWKKRTAWFLNWRNIIHTLILVSLLLVALFYIAYLLFWSLDCPLGLSVAFIAGLFYYTLYLVSSYKGNDASKKTYYASTLIFAVLIAMIVSRSIDNNHLDVNVVQDYKPETYSADKLALNAYTLQFKAQFAGARCDEVVPVYFIAANGGGTMQAYWTAAVLGYLREQTNDTIKKHIFAMSGASGGAVGLGLTTLSWHVPSDIIRKRMKDVYEYDFLSGGLAHLLGSDIWLSPLPFNLSCMRNRNSWLQAMYGLSIEKHLGSSQWEQPFMQTWSKNANQLQPLYFANTTMVERGERGVCSPIPLQSINSTGMDILMELSKDTQTLVFGEAVLLTERFPYLNTSGKIGELGHFADGGYYDNSGMETLLEAYRAVKEDLFCDSLNFQPRFIHLNFGTEAWNRYPDVGFSDLQDIDAIADQSELFVPLLTAYNTILSESVYNRVEVVEKNDLKLHRCYLPGSDLYLDHGKEMPGFNKECFDDAGVCLKLVVNPLGRTISKNQKKYVDCVLKLNGFQPKLELDKIISEVVCRNE